MAISSSQAACLTEMRDRCASRMPSARNSGPNGGVYRPPVAPSRVGPPAPLLGACVDETLAFSLFQITLWPGASGWVPNRWSLKPHAFSRA